MSKFSKKLKKGVKSVVNDPIGKGNLYSMVTGKSILDIGGSEGPDNPFAVPDLNYLRTPDQYTANLLKNFKGSGDFLKSTDPYFQEMIGKIGAPSSTDQVRSQVENEQMQSLLDSIRGDTRNAEGSYTASAADRGLVGPGISSDIYSVGQSGVLAGGGKSMADTRLSYALKELDRTSQREKAVQDAYAGRYGAATKGALQDTGLYTGLLGQQAQTQSERDTNFANIMAQLYSSAEDRKQKGKKPGYLDSFLQNFAQGAGQQGGSNAADITSMKFLGG